VRPNTVVLEKKSAALQDETFEYVSSIFVKFQSNARMVAPLGINSKCVTPAVLNILTSVDPTVSLLEAADP
jgi:hypothetical protein